MAEYLAQRIIDDRFTYEEVMAKRPTLKDGVDAYLSEHGRMDLISA